MTQAQLPIVEIRPDEILRQRSLGEAIDLCAKAGGYVPKQVGDELKLDKAQWSRWTSGQEGVCWPKFSALMDLCGNDAPLLWMVAARGYELHSMHKVESSVERENRLLREENKALRRVLKDAV